MQWPSPCRHTICVLKMDYPPLPTSYPKPFTSSSTGLFNKKEKLGQWFPKWVKAKWRNQGNKMFFMKLNEFKGLSFTSCFFSVEMFFYMMIVIDIIWGLFYTLDKIQNWQPSISQFCLFLFYQYLKSVPKNHRTRK